MKTDEDGGDAVEGPVALKSLAEPGFGAGRPG